MPSKPILQFKKEHRFLSNFWNCPQGVEFEGEVYRSAEHAYQAAKTTNTILRRMVAAAVTTSEAKAIGQTLVIRKDWEAVKYGIMHTVLLSKFTRNHHLRKLLIETGDAELVEGNTWHDNCWGNCSCAKCANIHGNNALGIILTAVRRELST